MKIRRLIIFGACAIAAGLALRFSVKNYSLYSPIAGHTTPLKEPLPAYTRALRPNYPYSVIPGGVYSNAELRYADQEDPVVKEHYADFNVRNAKMVELTEDKYQYASYRLKKKIYWTKKRLRIPKGEVLLTDGASWARARCGNRLSDSPQTQVSNEEPSIKALSSPPMVLGTPMEFAQNPPLGELSAITPISAPRLEVAFPSATYAEPPAEFPPLSLAPPVLPTVAVFPPGVPSASPAPSSPGSPNSTPPGLTPPSFTPSGPSGTPPLVPPTVIPPVDTPPVSTVPEPKAVYLFLVTFVVSLYGLTRMMPGQVGKPEKSDEISD